MQRLLWPWLEPVNDGAGGQAGEVAAARAQPLASRRQREYDVQVASAERSVGRPAGLLGFYSPVPCGLVDRPMNVSASLFWNRQILGDSGAVTGCATSLRHPAVAKTTY